MKKSSLEDLEIYNESFEISNTVWNLIQSWNFFDKSTLGKQFTRAADSVVLNISEGYGRYNLKENRHFCFYARGSFHESKTCLKLARTRKLISEEDHDALLNRMYVLGRKLNNYINYLNKQISNHSISSEQAQGKPTNPANPTNSSNRPIPSQC